MLAIAILRNEQQFQCCCYSFQYHLRSLQIIKKNNCIFKLYGRKPATGQSSSSSKSSQSSYRSRENDSASTIGQERTNTNPPIPSMPSQLFQQLAMSQLELLASALPADPNDINDHYDGKNHNSNNKYASKVKSMALYLPQENKNTGQLEFLPAVLFPNPNNERVFIANGVNSGIAPTLPKHLTTLPGYANAKSLLPAYPMVSSDDDDKTSTTTNAGVGVVEEVLCGLRDGGTALSVPLFIGSQTVGVLLVSPAVTKKPSIKKTIPTSNASNTHSNNIKLTKKKSFWTADDRKTVARAAKSLSLALSLDYERTELRIQNDVMYESLADSLHQFKNPLQALRTFGKLLQQRIADTTSETINDSTKSSSSAKSVPQILELAEHLMIQSDRLVERLKPVDEIVELLGEQQKQRNIQQQQLLLLPQFSSPPLVDGNKSSKTVALVPWRAPLKVNSVVDDEYDDHHHDEEETTRSRTKQPSKNRRNHEVIMDNVQNVTAEVVVGNDEDRIEQKIEPKTNVGSTSTTSSISRRLARTKNKVRRTGRMKILDDTTGSKREVLQSVPSTFKKDTIRPQSTESTNGSIISNMEFQMSFVQDVLEPVLIGFRAIAKEKKIQFEVLDGDDDHDDDLPGIMICPQALQEVFTNVLDNAFKYVMIGKPQQSFDNNDQSADSTNNHDPVIPITNPHPHVRVRFVSNTNYHHYQSIGQQNQQHSNNAAAAVGVTIIIEDNGPGISQLEKMNNNSSQEQSILFQRGYRNEQYKQYVDGNGIGLHIAYTLMERMGGIIRFVDPKLTLTTESTTRNRKSNHQKVPYLDGTIVELVLFRQIA